MSCPQTPERGEQHLPLCFPSCCTSREQRSDPSVSSPLSWTNVVSSAAPQKSCPLVLSSSLLLSLGWSNNIKIMVCELRNSGFMCMLSLWIFIFLHNLSWDSSHPTLDGYGVPYQFLNHSLILFSMISG